MANWFEVRAGTMIVAEARAYLQPGEIWGNAITSKNFLVIGPVRPSRSPLVTPSVDSAGLL